MWFVCPILPIEVGFIQSGKKSHFLFSHALQAKTPKGQTPRLFGPSTTHPNGYGKAYTSAVLVNLLARILALLCAKRFHGVHWIENLKLLFLAGFHSSQPQIILQDYPSLVKARIFKKSRNLTIVCQTFTKFWSLSSWRVYYHISTSIGWIISFKWLYPVMTPRGSNSKASGWEYSRMLCLRINKL